MIMAFLQTDSVLCEAQYYFLQFLRNLMMVLFALSSSFKLTDMHKNYSEIVMLPIS